jgi:hypothetical protein
MKAKKDIHMAQTPRLIVWARLGGRHPNDEPRWLVVVVVVGVCW